MAKDWALLIYNADTGKVSTEIFTEVSASEARRDFNDCYRHGNWKILAVAEVPDPEKKGA